MKILTVILFALAFFTIGATVQKWYDLRTGCTCEEETETDDPSLRNFDPFTIRNWTA